MTVNSKWLERERLHELEMERFTLAANRLFAALDKAICAPRGDPIAIAHKLLNTLPVTRKVTAMGWSDETRAAHQVAIAEHSVRMKRRYAA